MRKFKVGLRTKQREMNDLLNFTEPKPPLGGLGVKPQLKGIIHGIRSAA
jgi:hypothetical protein